MLVSGDHCADVQTPCAKVEPEPGSIASPIVQLTLQGNVFGHTGQRHPRVSGRAFAHVVDNVVLYGAYRRFDGRYGATYGAYAANGGMIYAEDSLYLPLVSAASRPAIDAQEKDTSISGRGAITALRMAGAEARNGGDRSDVAAPDYALHGGADFADPVSATRCTASRAGIGGWERPIDTPCR